MEKIQKAREGSLAVTAVTDWGFHRLRGRPFSCVASHIPSCKEGLAQRRLIAGPASTTLAQQLTDAGPILNPRLINISCVLR